MVYDYKDLLRRLKLRRDPEGIEAKKHCMKKRAEVVQASNWIGKVFPQFEGGEDTDVFRVHGGPANFGDDWFGGYATYGDVITPRGLDKNVSHLILDQKTDVPSYDAEVGARNNKLFASQKVADKVFSYGCNRLGWGSPKSFDSLYGGRLNQVTMVPEGLGSPPLQEYPTVNGLSIFRINLWVRTTN